MKTGQEHFKFAKTVIRQAIHWLPFTSPAHKGDLFNIQWICKVLCLLGELALQDVSRIVLTSLQFATTYLKI